MLVAALTLLVTRQASPLSTVPPALSLTSAVVGFSKGMPPQASKTAKKFVGKWAYWSLTNKNRFPEDDLEILASGKVLFHGNVASYQVIDASRVQVSYGGHDVLYTYKFEKNGDLRLTTASTMVIMYQGYYRRK